MVTEAQKKATKKYIKEHYETLATIVPKGTKEIIKQEAADDGVSLNRYVKNAIIGHTDNTELKNILSKGTENEPGCTT